MELGQKIRQARLEAGLSQRQLCGETITRNMLSLIENGAARPSMDTLQYLADRLGKAVSYFLEEQVVTSPNQVCMEQARACWKAGNAAGTLEALSGFRQPDAIFSEEQGLLSFLALVTLATEALAQRRLPYARTLLDRAGEAQSIYLTEDLHRSRKLLLAQLGEESSLPSDDPALLIRAQLALNRQDVQRALALLDAAEDKAAPRWALLQGNALLALGRYQEAADALRLAEGSYPEQVWPGLEQCSRELGDFRMAYEYACRQRKVT